MPLIKNVPVFYVAAGENPTMKYKETLDPDNEWANKEYQVQFLIQPKLLKELRKAEGKGVNQFKKPRATDLTLADLIEKMKLPEDYKVDKSFFNGDDELTLMQFSAPASYKSDGARSRNRLEIKGINKGAMNKDRNGVELTQEIGIGNGTICHIQWAPEPYEYKGTPGIRANPTKLFVVDLIEYVSGGTADEFEGEECDFDEQDEFKGEDAATTSDDDWEDD